MQKFFEYVSYGSKNRSSSGAGFTLIESIIAIGIFIIVATGIFFAYSNLLDIFSASYLNLTAVSALDSELEIIRNMSYADVGIQGGSPSGVLTAEKDLIYGNINFVVRTSVRNVDDSFDGTQGGNPNDLSPADYKLVEVEITCPTCPRYIPAKATTTVAPAGLETMTNKGSLVIKVFNASGQPISGANVLIINNNVVPAININDITDSGGILRLIDIATSSVGYEVTVTKSGYSTDKTYPPGNPSNPNPLKPNLTVLEQQTTETSFVIDRVSTVNVRTQDKFCSGIGSVDFLQTGQKLIGTNPDVLKYSVAGVTNSSGDRAVNNLEFDTYTFRNQDANYEVSGFNPVDPIAVDPNGTYGFVWLMEAKNLSSIVVTVRDQNNQLIDDAKVIISRTGFSDEEFTGVKSLAYTDWSGGTYDSKSANLDVASPAGTLTLALVGGKYASMSDEWLISQTINFGTANTNFYNLVFSPLSQPAQTSLKVQLASNNDNTSWNFIGPDGTANSYYTVSDTQIHSGHNGDRYLRYKVILRTDDNTVTPSLEDIGLDFSSSCIPDGQVYFSGLSQTTYNVTVEKSGYNTFTDTAVILDENWEDYRATLIP